MAVMNIKMLADLILKLSPIILDASQLVKKWRKREIPEIGEIPSREDLPARIDRLEKNLELQSKLNEEFVSEMQILKPALEGIQRSIRILYRLVLLAFGLALVSVILLLLK